MPSPIARYSEVLYATTEATRGLYIRLWLIPVQVSNRDDLPAHVVVEPVDRVGVDEAVSHPGPRLHHLLDLPQHLQPQVQRQSQRVAGGWERRLEKTAEDSSRRKIEVKRR